MVFTLKTKHSKKFVTQPRLYVDVVSQISKHEKGGITHD